MASRMAAVLIIDDIPVNLIDPHALPLFLPSTIKSYLNKR